jgi:hypothetical protein
MSHTKKVLPVLLGAMAITACGDSPAAPTLDVGSAYSAVAPRTEGSRPVPTRPGSDNRDPRGAPTRPRPDDRKPRRDPRPDVDRPDRRPDQNRLEAAARAAIEDALQALERASELVGRDTRPAVQEALAEARQMISQAIEAYNNGDFSRALVKANEAAEIISSLLRMVG